MSVGGMVEVDGTGVNLHERSDWPLVASGPMTKSDVNNDAGQAEPARVGGEAKDLVLGIEAEEKQRDGDGNMEEHRDSKMTASESNGDDWRPSDVEANAARPLQRAAPEPLERQMSQRSVHEILPRPESQPLASPLTPRRQAALAAWREERRQSSLRSSPSPQPVSPPIAQEQDESARGSLLSRPSPDLSSEGRRSVEDVRPMTNGTIRPAIHPKQMQSTSRESVNDRSNGNSFTSLHSAPRESSSSLRSQQSEVSRESEAGSGTNGHMVSPPDVIATTQSTPDRPLANGHSTRPPPRELTTPTPSIAHSSTPAVSPRLNSHTTPSAPHSHARVSSMQKGPLSRSASTRSAYGTTQLPPKDARVRYSWQSLLPPEDDEASNNRPRIHIIKLVSNTATASAGFPGGEAFGFSISPAGRRIAAYNSARLYVLQTAALPVGISQDYALKRRPLAVEVVDEGDVIAILADEFTVNVYDLGHHRLRRTKTIKLDFPTSVIALAPTGGLLAAAYEGGVEIFSLAASALPTDRRAVRSQRMDRLTFSEDGSTLLGTTTRINVSSTMLVSVPVFPAAQSNIPTPDELKEAWCSSLLHPENIRSSSHATFMRSATDRTTVNDRVFSWNGAADTFGVLSVEDMSYGEVDFPVVISPPLSSCGGLGAAIHSVPAVDEWGGAVAMVVNDRTVRLYIVPPTPSEGGSETNGATVEAHSIDHELDEGYGCPFSEVRWVYSSASLPSPAPPPSSPHVQGRLIVTSPGGVLEPGLHSDENVDADIEGGRIILFDFDAQFAGQPGQTFVLTLGKSPPRLLEEPTVDVADEVALVRRRTINLSRGGGLSQRPVTLGRAATTFGGRDRTSNSGRRSVLSTHSLSSLDSPTSPQHPSRALPDVAESPPHSPAVSEGVPFADEPYAQNAPRSQASMQRAASNAQRHRYQTLEERTQERGSAESATGGFLPLPEYTEEPNAPLPSRFRALAGLDGPKLVDTRPPAILTGAAAGQGTPDSASAVQAFRTARETYSAQSTPTSSTPNSGMPRSLQRAYSNAIAPMPLGVGAAPNLIGEWENVSPVVGTPGGGRRGAPSSITSSVPEEDVISPVLTRESLARQQFMTQTAPYRYSTSLLNPPGHTAPNQGHNYPVDTNGIHRLPSSAHSFNGAPTSPLSVEGGRRMPPHMLAFRNAAAASTPSSASASLFPPAQAPDHVPIRVAPPPAKAGTVAHPITAWHPPSASSPLTQPSSSDHSGPGRRGSVGGRSAYSTITTERGGKRGVFGRRKKTPFAPGPLGQGQGKGDGSVMETKSMMTWRGRKAEEGSKCEIM